MLTILMAAYNGERYIGEQIESILKQTYEDWTLIIRDDGSTDGTLEAAQKYTRQYPDRIILLEGENSGSAANNFFMLLTQVDSDYVMFCDNDDVWLPDKIRKTMDKMREIEGRVGHDRPVLVHTDLSVVDAQLNTVADSMFAYQKLDPVRNGLNHLLVQNIVTGCTMMANRSLVEKALPQPAHAAMHDWWLALVAAALGEIGCICEATVQYRQHGGNAVGAKQSGNMLYAMKRLSDFSSIKNDMRALFLQASDFLDRYRGWMTASVVSMFEDFVSIPTLGFCDRFRIFCRHKIWKRGLLRKVGQLLVSGK